MSGEPNGLPLHVETRGEHRDNAETFLLLHGYGGCSFSWRFWAPALERRGRVHLVDLKGFGASPRPRDSAYAPTDHAELVVDLVRRLDMRNLTIVGHSLGGGVALLTALRLRDTEPHRVRRLVVVAGAAYRQRMPPFVGMAQRPRLARAIVRLLGTRLLIGQVLRTIVYEPGAITRTQIDGYADPLTRPGSVHALLETAAHIVPPDLDRYTERYATLDVPALLMWGDHDQVVPPTIGQRLVRDLPDATLAIIPRCGHLPAEERPEESLRLFEAFLDGSAPRAR